MKKDTQTLYDLQPGDVQEEKPHRVQKRRRSRKWLWLTLTVLVVLGVVAAAVLWDANSFDGLRRSIIYARAEKDETGCAKLYYYENDATSRFTALEGSLVMVAANQIRVLDEHSNALYQTGVRFLSPDLAAGGDIAHNDLQRHDRDLLHQRLAVGNLFNIMGGDAVLFQHLHQEVGHAVIDNALALNGALLQTVERSRVILVFHQHHTGIVGRKYLLSLAFIQLLQLLHLKFPPQSLSSSVNDQLAILFHDRVVLLLPQGTKLRGQLGVLYRENLRRQQRRICRTVDGHRRHGHSRRHLHRGQQRVQSVQRGGLHRDADHRQHGLRRQRTRQMRRLARRGDQHAEAVLRRR